MADKKKFGIKSPILQDVVGAGATLGMIGSLPIAGANAIGEYITGNRSKVADDIVDRNIALYKEAKGIGASPVVATPNQPAPVKQTPSAVVPPAVAPAVNPATVQAHPLDKYDNIYDALKALPDDKFRKYVDKYGDNTPGIGYITTIDPKTKKERIERITDNPANRQEPMSLAEAEIATRLVGGIGAREDARASRQEANDIKRMGIQSQDESRKATQENLKEDNFLQLAKANAKKVVNQKTFQEEDNYDDFILKTALTNPEIIPPQWKGVAQNAKSKYESYLKDVFKTNKDLKDTPQARLLILERYMNPPQAK